MLVATYPSKSWGNTTIFLLSTKDNCHVETAATIRHRRKNLVTQQRRNADLQLHWLACGKHVGHEDGRCCVCFGLKLGIFPRIYGPIYVDALSRPTITVSHYELLEGCLGMVLADLQATTKGISHAMICKFHPRTLSIVAQPVCTTQLESGSAWWPRNIPLHRVRRTDERTQCSLQTFCITTTLNQAGPRSNHKFLNLRAFLGKMLSQTRE